MSRVESGSEAPRSPAPPPPRPVRRKEIPSLEAAFDACEIQDGATLSFHHHLRNGDAVANAVLAVAAKRRLRGLRLAMTSVFPVHAPLVDWIRQGVVERLWTGYAKGPVAGAISDGLLRHPAVFQSHGGRAGAVESGRLPIDVAFIAAPCADIFGGAVGSLGPAACGPLGYPRVDAEHAARVVVVADAVQDALLAGPEIAPDRVDHVVRVGSIGDAGGVVSGSTRATSDPMLTHIAERAVAVADACGALAQGWSFQTGAGGASLAAVAAFGRRATARGLTGDFMCGGVTGRHVALARAGLFKRILNVQSFDLDAVRSYAVDPWHEGVSAARYASPFRADAAVNGLSVVLLGAAEIDRGFNINVTTSGDGGVIGGPGGHPDTAKGAALTVATTKLTGGGYPKVVDRVGCVTTPGCDVDVLVTELGVAVNPARPDLAERLRGRGPPLMSIDAMIEAAERMAERAPDRGDAAVAAVIERPEGGVVDHIPRRRSRGA